MPDIARLRELTAMTKCYYLEVKTSDIVALLNAIDAAQAACVAAEADASAARKRVRELVDEVAHQAAKVPQTIQACDDLLNDMEAHAAQREKAARRTALEDAAKRVEGTSPRFIYKEVADVLRAMMEETHDRHTRDNRRNGGSRGPQDVRGDGGPSRRPPGL